MCSFGCKWQKPNLNYLRQKKSQIHNNDRGCLLHLSSLSWTSVSFFSLSADYFSSHNRNMPTGISWGFPLTTLAICRETTSTLWAQRPRPMGIAYWPSLSHKPSSRPINSSERSVCVRVCVCAHTRVHMCVMLYNIIVASERAIWLEWKEGGSQKEAVLRKQLHINLLKYYWKKRERTGLDDEKELMLGILCEVKGEKKV